MKLEDAPVTKCRSRTEPVDLWAQREYVACNALGVGFSAQGDTWIYHHGQPGTFTIPAPNPSYVLEAQDE